MNQAERLGAPWVVIVGPRGVGARGRRGARHARREQDEVSLSSLRQELLARAR